MTSFIIVGHVWQILGRGGFLKTIIKNNFIPKFLQFKFANRNPHNYLAYNKYQIKLLEEAIRAKRKRNNILEKDTKIIWKYKQGTLFCLNFSYICYLFLVSNDKSVLHHDNIQKRKLKNLLEISSKEVINDSLDSNKIIYNFSLHELKDIEKSVLYKCLSFSIKPK